MSMSQANIYLFSAPNSFRRNMKIFLMSLICI